VVEALFVEHGFAVVSPEELTLTEQAWMFHEAEVVAGFAGSALFNVLLTDRPKHLVMVSSDTYGPSNEYMIAALRGHRLDLAVSKAVRRTGPKARAYQAPFTFDPEREGVWLRRVLEGLPDELSVSSPAPVLETRPSATARDRARS
jgi:capsular polysaccharide biosynthesis protein